MSFTQQWHLYTNIALKLLVLKRGNYELTVADKNGKNEIEIDISRDYRMHVKLAL